MAWQLNPALTGFRSAVNTAYPRRDRTSDGTIGDEAHQSRTSDHNPDLDGSVDAWDMDVEVNGPGKPYAEDVEMLKRVFQQHESSSYWIHNDQIAKRSTGWRRESYAYAGPARNRHTRHVHFNTRESHERSTKPWILEDDMTEAERKLLTDMAWQVRNVPNIEGGRMILTGAVSKLVARVLAAEKTLAALAQASPLTQAQWAEVRATAEAEAREEVAEALRAAADAAQE